MSKEIKTAIGVFYYPSIRVTDPHYVEGFEVPVRLTATQAIVLKTVAATYTNGCAGYVRILKGTRFYRADIKQRNSGREVGRTYSMARSWRMSGVK